MKKIAIMVALIVAVAAAGSFTAVLAHGDGEGRRSMRDHRRSFGPGSELGPALRGLRALDLSDEQRSAIRGKVADAMPELGDLRDRMRGLKDQVRAGVEQGFAEGNSIEQLAREIGDLTAQMTISRARLGAEIHSVLTQEQAAELAEKRARRKERREQRRERFENELAR